MTKEIPTLFRRALIAASLTVLIVHTVLSQGFSGCPGCFKNVSVMDGHGPASTTDSRRVINVRIDSSWGSQTPANIWNATCAGSQTAGCSNVTGPSAISMWNAVPTYYNLRLTQDNSQPNAATDIQISRDSSWNRRGCAYTQLLGPKVADPVTGGDMLQVTKRVIHLPPGSENWSQDQLACVLGHEMGHALGLTDVKSGCSTSVMNQIRRNPNGCAGGCTRTEVPDRDKESVNQQAGNRAGCNKTALRTSLHIQPGGGFQDPTPFRYNPTCYYYYDAIDVYYCRYISIEDGSCHPDTPPEYIGTIYVLRDVFCF